MITFLSRQYKKYFFSLAFVLVGVFAVIGGLGFVNQDVNAQFAQDYCSPISGLPYFCDADSDGFNSSLASGYCGDASSPFPGCVVAGCVTQPGGDCNDSNGAINTGVLEVCGDSLDNNCDGQVDEGCGFDCGDGICELGETCASDCSPEPYCSDGVDNDGNLATDCADLSCASQPACLTSSEICDNNLDNDGDGFIGCADFDCAGQQDSTGATCCGSFSGPDNNLCGSLTCQACVDDTTESAVYGGSIGNNGSDDSLNRCAALDSSDGFNCTGACSVCSAGACENRVVGDNNECSGFESCQINPGTPPPDLTCQVPNDPNPPVLNVSSPADGTTVITNQVSISGNAIDDIGVVKISILNNTNGGSISDFPASATNLDWTMVSPGLDPGINSITVIAYDAADNSSNLVNLSVIYTPPDIQDPVVNISSPATPFVTTVPTLDLAGIASDNVAVILVSWVNSVGGSGDAIGTDSWTISNVPLQPWPIVNNITVTAYDADGNFGTASVSVRYNEPDSSPPTIEITSPTTNPTLDVFSQPLTLGGTAADIDSGIVSVDWVNSTGGSGSAGGASPWTFSNINLNNGSNIITITATNGAGLTATDSINVNYTFVPDSCNETDGGQVYDVSGTVSGDNTGIPYSNNDVCSTSTTLVEYYCVGNQSANENFDCAAVGAICVSGACVSPTELICDDGIDNDGDGNIDCVDSDCAGQTGPGSVQCCQVGGDCSQAGGNCSLAPACDVGVTFTCAPQAGSDALCNSSGNSCGVCVQSGVSYDCQADLNVCGVGSSCQDLGGLGNDYSCVPDPVACTSDVDGDGICDDVDDCPYVPFDPSNGIDINGLCAVGCSNFDASWNTLSNSGTGTYGNGYLCSDPLSVVVRDTCRGALDSSGCIESNSCRAIFGGIEYMNLYINGRFLTGNLTLPQNTGFNPPNALIGDTNFAGNGDGIRFIVDANNSGFFFSGQPNVVALEAYTSQQFGGVLMRQIRGAFANIADTGLCSALDPYGITKRTDPVTGGSTPDLPLKCLAINDLGYSAMTAPPVDGFGLTWLDAGYDDSSWVSSDFGNSSGALGPIEDKLWFNGGINKYNSPLPIWADDATVNYSTITNSHVFCRAQF